MASTQQWIKENQTPRSNQGPRALQAPQLSHRGRYNSRLSSMHTLESDLEVWGWSLDTARDLFLTYKVELVIAPHLWIHED